MYLFCLFVRNIPTRMFSGRVSPRKVLSRTVAAFRHPSSNCHGIVHLISMLTKHSQLNDRARAEVLWELAVVIRLRLQVRHLTVVF